MPHGSWRGVDRAGSRAPGGGARAGRWIGTCREVGCGPRVERIVAVARRRCLIALGANLASSVGPPARTLRMALCRLPGHGIRVLRCSRGYSNPAWPPGAGPDFVNAVVLAESSLPPRTLLRALRRVEAGFGRGVLARSGPRRLDLDLLDCGGRVCPGPARWRRFAIRETVSRTGRPDLLLPHPALHRRPFVLVPLLDVAPHWRHPAFGLRASVLCAELNSAQRAAVVPLGPLQAEADRGQV